MNRLSFLVQGFTLALLGDVLLASVWPCTGTVAVALSRITVIAIGLLFFLHGARLSREAVAAGVKHWRLHLTVLSSTFLLFPIIGAGAQAGVVATRHA